MRDDPREWELWWVIIGSCLSSGTARETVFAKIKPEDCPYTSLRGILSAMQTGDAVKIKQALSECYYLSGVDWTGGCLAGIVERVKATAEQRRRVADLEAELKEVRK